MKRLLPATVVVLVALGACGDSGVPLDEAKDLARADRPCAEVYAEGRVFKSTSELAAALCKRGEQLYLPGSGTDRCSDGRTLFWNDEGWGYLGEPFHRHAAGAEQVAPEPERTRCKGS